MKKITILSSVLMLICSCGSLYDVSETRDNKGFEFYTYQVVETTTAVYEESYYRIELEVTRMKKAEDASTKKKNIPISTEGNAPKPFIIKAVKYSSVNCGNELNIKFNSSPNIQSALNSVKGVMLRVDSQNGTSISASCDFLNAPFQREGINAFFTASDNNSLPHLLQSINKSYSTRPNPNPKYVNVRKPFAGSVEGTFTFNNDGTLTSAASKVQEDLVGKIVDQLPIGEVVGSVFGIPDGAEDESTADLGKLVSVKLTLIPIKIVYTISSEKYPESNSGKVTMPTADNYSGYTITQKKGSFFTEKTKKKEEGTVIKLNGSLTIPKKNE